jgi:ATP-dependent protease ClpP protease subunit
MMPRKITIDGEIGRGEDMVNAAWVKSQLPLNGTDPIEVEIHSEGGSVFEGFAIYDALREYSGPKKCVISSSAFSIASFIPMAFDEVEITPNGYMMLHSPYVAVEGNDEELAKQSQLLSQLKSNMVQAYCTKTGKTPDEVQAILSRETYFSASEAVAAGLANRITQTPIVGRVFAKTNHMPHGIVQALFGAGPSGDNCEQTREKSMSETQKPVAATVSEIKRKFPKAKDDFIVKCMEKEMAMEDVATAAMEETMAENETLAMKVQAMEDELKALKAKAMEVEVEPEEEKPMMVAKAKAGVEPIAKAKAVGGVSAKAKWKDAINDYVAKGFARDKAIVSVDRDYPGLREQMLAEVNS